MLLPDTDLHRQAARTLEGRRRFIADRVTERHFQAHPGLDARYGVTGRVRCREDAEYHLVYLEQAVAASSPELFGDYVTWASSMLDSRGVPESDLAQHMQSLLGLVRETLPEGEALAVDAVALPALDRLRAAAPASVVAQDSPARAFLEALRQAGPQGAQRVIRELTGSGLSLRELYVDVIQPGLQEIGRLWQLNQITVADEHYFTAAIQVVIAQLYPQLFAKAPTRAPIVIACASGELHEIGARMVADLLQLEGYDSHYLGASTPVRELVDFVSAKRAAVLGLSLSTAASLSRLESAVSAIRTDARTRAVRIVVGGAPFSRLPGLWKTVGADAHARDAHHAIEVFNGLAR